MYPVFFYILHGVEIGSVSIRQSLNCKNVDKYTAVNSASSSHRSFTTCNSVKLFEKYFNYHGHVKY